VYQGKVSFNLYLYCQTIQSLKFSNFTLLISNQIRRTGNHYLGNVPSNPPPVQYNRNREYFHHQQHEMYNTRPEYHPVAYPNHQQMTRQNHQIGDGFEEQQYGSPEPPNDKQPLEFSIATEEFLRRNGLLQPL